MEKTFQKYNSFFGIRIKDKYDKEKFLSNLKFILNDKNNLLDLNQNSIKILGLIKKDLFNFNSSDKLRFILNPNVVKEIQSINRENIPKYLVHRYRYEIYPQQRICDEFPPYLQIEPTSICNYRCVFCYQTDEKFNKRSGGFMGHMKLETFKLLIDQAEGNVEFISLASRGEPLLCPDIKKMLAYTRDKFLNLKINTNASMLDEEMTHSIFKSGVKTVVFSVDAADSAMYSKLRVNGKLEKILENIKQFKRIKQKHYSKSNIITRVSGVKVNEKQTLDSMEKYWGDLVDQVAFVNYIPWENVYESKYTHIKTPCSDLWRRMFVWWDGTTNPCDVDYKSKLKTGNINNHNISELWQSSVYKNLRKKHELNLRKDITPCSRCNVI